MTLISVVLPCYNAALYLRESLESVINQTAADWELIAVIEPNHTDNTAEILEEYAKKDARFRLVFNKNRIGLPASLNLGIENASGRFIARVDADDICLPERFAKQVDFLDCHADISLVGTRVKMIDAKGRSISYKDDNPTESEQIKSDLLFRCVLRHSTVMFRREDFKDFRYDETLKAAEDFELWNRAARSLKFSNLPEVLTLYRWTMSGATHTNEEAEREVYINTLRRSLESIIEPVRLTEHELRMLCVLTCDIKLTNYKTITERIKNLCGMIQEKNRERIVYDENALAETMRKRLRFSRTAAAARTIAGENAKIQGFARYIEANGLNAAIRRVLKM